jgi:hypothetical protein
LEEGCGGWPFGYVQDKFQGRREGEREIGAVIAIDIPKTALLISSPLGLFLLSF